MAKAKIKKVAQAEIRAAKKYLKRRNISFDEISPRKFVRLSKQLDKTYDQTMKYLAKILSAGQV